MTQNSRFSVAVHSLLLMATSQDKQKMTSNIIAESTGMNAVTIRHAFRQLKNAGLIEIRPGPGGAKLAMKPAEITLYAIWSAVQEDLFSDIFHLNQNNSKWCPVGRNVNNILTHRLESVVDAASEQLRSVTLHDLLDDLNKIEPLQ